MAIVGNPNAADTRARPRGIWRSNLYEYAVLSDWLPDVDLASITPQEARVWLVRRYLAAVGLVTFNDVEWWTGFSKGETQEDLGALKPGEYLPPRTHTSFTRALE